MRRYIFFTIVMFSVLLSATESNIFERVLRKIKNYGFTNNNTLILINISEQKLILFEKGVTKKTFSISSAKAGAGNISGSNKTPLGTHRIVEMNGRGEPLGRVFRWGNPTKEIAKLFYDKTDVAKDLITTRVMKLRGVEKGKNLGGNVDSYNRGIWIHGTQEEGLIGTPVSHGCIRMKNEEVIELYNLVKTGTFVEIITN